MSQEETSLGFILKYDLFREIWFFKRLFWDITHLIVDIGKTVSV